MTRYNTNADMAAMGTGIAARPRLALADMMVGVAMTLVALGHASFGFEPEWYARGLHEWIYAFHMPLFMFLSGLLMRHSYRGTRDARGYLRYVGRRLAKFAPPFLLVGAAAGLAAAWPQGGWEAQGGARAALLAMSRALAQQLQWPMQGPASFLWYIYVLMGFYLTAPAIFALSSRAKGALWLVAAAAALLPGVTHRFALALFCKYAPFWLLGALCAEGLGWLRRLGFWTAALATLPFALWTLLFALGWRGAPPLATGMAALPAAALLGMGMLRVPAARRAMEALSRGVWWAYLLHLPVAWACAMGWRAAGAPGRLPFAIFLPACATLSLVLPLAARALARRLARHRRTQKSGGIAQ